MVMGFWGLHVRPDKTYTQVVDATFQLTMAALGDDAEDGKRSCLKVTVDKKDFILCSLTLGKMEQQPLNVAFVENEEVTFSVSGKNSVHLTGNYLDDDDDDDDDDDTNPYFDQGLMELPFDESDEEDEVVDTNHLEIKTKGAQRLSYLHPDDDESDSEDEDWEDEESDENDDENEDQDEEQQDEEQQDKTSVKDTKKRPSSGSVPSSAQEQSAKKQKTSAEPNGKATVQKKDGQQRQQQQQKEKKKELPVKKEEKKTETSSKKGEKKTEIPAKSDDKKADSNSEEKPKKTTLPNGLVIEDVKIGTGPKAKSGKKIGMRYIGRLSSGKIFDSNLKGKPFYFNLGKGEVIKGWDIGVTGMQLGGERKLTIPAPLAYGSQGAPPDIPKNATLEFEVKLINIK